MAGFCRNCLPNGCCGAVRKAGAELTRNPSRKIAGSPSC
ncbi:MAG: DUF1244 domain-containing protein [Hydrogenophaga sp.]|nr:DUF1244 domain-containing protein [Hydrogenophaga sp.]